MDTRRHLLDTCLGTMHVRTAGAGGTPLVLLHMSPLSGRMFDRVLPYLATDRLVIVPDRIGFGYSDDLQEPVELARYVDATRDALDGLAIERFDVVGIHTGSAEALELATASPERVRRVGVVTLSVFTPEQLAEFKAHYGPPPEPAADGSHLARYWQWWMDAGVEQHGESWPLDIVHSHLLDHLRAGPNVWWTYHAVFDYPSAEKVQQVT
jgi:pimeloyl-ACP methyl ester carboxylesterase